MTLKRLTGTVATAGVLAALAFPVAAHAADFLQPGGIIIPGSALRVGVSGGTGYAGNIQARFAATGSPLYWGDVTHTSVLVPPNLNDETAAMFALQTPSGVYSPVFAYAGSPQPFTQTSPPALAGTGTVPDPWTVTSTFDASGTLHITQTVTHVDGTTEFLGTWAVYNTDVVPISLKAFEGGDLYVSENDNGVGSLTGSVPNRRVQSVASDGTTAELIEQPGAPWSHYFTGDNSRFYGSVFNDNYPHHPDTADPTMQDSGEGSEWDFTLTAGATETVSVMWHFTQPAPPLAPDVANVPAPLTTQTTAAPTFSPHAGDIQVVGYECSLDGSTYAACTSPGNHAGLADGPHSFRVRGLNSAGIPGPATGVAWTVDTVAPDAPAITTAPPAISGEPSASITLAAEPAATLECSVDGAAYAPCTGPLVLTGLGDGPHSVSVRQTDAAGHTGPAATASWTVDTTVPPAPASLTAPADSTARSATVVFAGDDGMTHECSVDASEWAACTSPVTVAGLAAGPHTLRVRQVSPAGIRGPASATAWTTLPASATDVPPTACVSVRGMRVHWTVPPRAHLKRITVTLNGRRVATLAPSRRAYTVSLHGRPAQIVRVQIGATTRAGHRIATTRVYTTCSKTRLPARITTIRMLRLR